MRFHILVTVLLISTVSRVWAEEGGTGHYLPGSMSSFIDSVPADPTFIARLNVIGYDASFGGGSLPIAGVSAFDVEAKSGVLGLTMVWRPKLELRDGLSYAVGGTIPFLSVDVEATVSTGTTTVRRSDKEEGLGDIMFMPVMLNHQISPNLGFNYRLSIYAPTGSYKEGRLANLGKNFWTFEPSAAVVYLNQKKGFEASAYVGIDFNTKNNDTHYQSGTQAHIDGTLAQHFPLGKGLAGAGLTGYWYEQIEGDSGSGATFGSFKARTVGIGPVLSYTHKLKRTDLIAELKWLHEFETRNRLEGDYLWLKIVLKF